MSGECPDCGNKNCACVDENSPEDYVFFSMEQLYKENQSLKEQIKHHEAEGRVLRKMVCANCFEADCDNCEDNFEFKLQEE